MWAVTWKGLLAHKVRLALTSLAIVLGVAFVAGTFVLTDSLSASFEGLFADISGSVDVYVNPRVEFDVAVPGAAGPSFDAPTIAGSVLDAVRAVDGVAFASGGVQGTVVMLDRDGEPIGGNGPPQFGFSYEDGEAAAGSPITLRQGRAPAASDEVAIDVASATTGGYTVGDAIALIADGGRGSFTITGLTGFGDEDSLLGATIATFDLATARTLFDKEGVYDQISIVATDGTDQETLRDRIAEILPTSAEAVTAADETESQLSEVRGFLGFFNTALLSFGVVALFVGAFIIANTFSIVVAQRSREYALLRALGASTRQVTRSVLLEAVIVGLVSAILGIFVGILLASGIRGLLGVFGLTFPDGGTVLLPRTIIAALTIGLLITVLSALAPSLRAAQVAPVEAMRGTGAAGEGSSRIRSALGAFAFLGGTASLAKGLIAGGSNALAAVGAGAALTMLGVSLLAPLIAAPVTGWLGLLFASLGVPGRLARENARRNPKRTASTASALMIGLALVSFVTILAASITASIAVIFTEQFRADLIVSAGGQGGPPAPLPGLLAQELADAPELAEVSPVRLGGTVLIDTTAVTGTRAIAGVATEVISELVSLGDITGDVAGVGEDDFLATAELATSEGWAIGDTVRFGFPAVGESSLRLAGTYTNDQLIGAPLLLSLDGWDARHTGAADFVIYANVADGVDLATATGVVDAALRIAPSATVQDQATFRQQQSDGIGQLLNLMIVLLLFAIVIALIGITNTMALSVFERTRELGLLRAVGMTGTQVKRMVRMEAALVAAFGGVLGVAVGSFFGWAVVRALRDEGLGELVLPVGRLLLYVIVAAIAGVAAGSFPARRAAKLDVLAAVTSE